jgi:TetR/AcrR family transcriptional repressor of nem operon
MKKSKAETAETRKRIVETASKAIRSKGIDATGVAEIMATAGLTHGGFYRHFASKDQLVAEAIATSPKDFLADTEAAAEKGAEAVLDVFADYVTPGYRDAKELGCPLAANGSELVRADDNTRHIATEGFRRIIKAVAPYMHSEPGTEPTDASISILTNMIGALTIARMVDDPALSEQILAVANKRVRASIEVAPKKARRAKDKVEA